MVKSMINHSILLIDGEGALHTQCAELLAGHGIELVACDNIHAGLDQLAQRPFDAVMLDPSIEQFNAETFRDAINTRADDTIVIIYTDYANMSLAEKLFDEGAFECVYKPFRENAIFPAIKRALLLKKHQYCIAGLSTLASGASVVPPLTGASRCIAEAIGTVRKASGLTMPVLISGPPGSGKCLIARTIHNQSKRHKEPFLTVARGRHAPDELHALLFPKANGGNNASKVINLSQAGTLFIEELAEIPLKTQTALLELLRMQSGDKEPTMRIIMATEHDPDAWVRHGMFRKDLMFRLRSIHLDILPLSQRQEDIDPLIRLFLQRFNESRGTKVKIDSAASSRLSRCAWPGNVAQLEHILYHAASICRSSLIRHTDVPAFILNAAPSPVTNAAACIDKSFNDAKQVAVAHFEHSYLMHQLLENKGNVTHAAGSAGMHRSSFQRLFRKYGIHPQEMKKHIKNAQRFEEEQAG
ncbi:MAG: response regulator [Chitinivibrionales bacterium]|nr:response regulator [Chitinivibrionales bacterium]